MAGGGILSCIAAVQLVGQETRSDADAAVENDGDGCAGLRVLMYQKAVWLRVMLAPFGGAGKEGCTCYDFQRAAVACLVCRWWHVCVASFKSINCTISLCCLCI